MLISSDLIRHYAREQGFNLCGIARSRIMSEQDGMLVNWLQKGYDSGLAYLSSSMDKRSDPSRLVPDAKTIIVCAVNYKNEAWDQTKRNVYNKVASYACLEDYHVTIKEKLYTILEKLRLHYPNLQGRCFTDSAPVYEKNWAVEAGLGWIGKNTLLVNPRYGSFLLLGEIIIDCESDNYDKPFGKQRCGSCTRCIDSCPSGALVLPRVIDTNKCISRLTTQKLPDGIQQDKTKLHGWIFGCDECQTCCPHNQKSPENDSEIFPVTVDPFITQGEYWESMTPKKFEANHAKTPMGFMGFERIRKNIVVRDTKENRQCDD